MEDRIRKIAYELIEEEAGNWDYSDDKDKLVSTLAYNDGVMAMTYRVIEMIKDIISELETNLNTETIYADNASYTGLNLTKEASEIFAKHLKDAVTKL